MRKKRQSQTLQPTRITLGQATLLASVSTHADSPRLRGQNCLPTLTSPPLKLRGDPYALRLGCQFLSILTTTWAHSGHELRCCNRISLSRYSFPVASSWMEKKAESWPPEGKDSWMGESHWAVGESRSDGLRAVPPRSLFKEVPATQSMVSSQPSAVSPSGWLQLQRTTLLKVTSFQGHPTSHDQ